MLLPLAPVTYLPQESRRPWMRRWSLPWVATTGGLVGVGYLLHRNAWNVATGQGRSVYGGLFMTLLGSFLVYCFLWRRAEGCGLLGQMPRLSRLTARTLSLVAGIVLLLFAFEAGARAFPIVDSLAVNPGTHYFWPDYFDAHNSVGMDDREPVPKRGLRILVIGDSYTEGAGVPKSERFSAKLERLLAASAPGVEVYNAGSCGLDTFEEADVLDRVGDAIQPDVVIVGYCLNDAEGENPPSRRPPTLAERVFLRTLGSYAYYRAHRTHITSGSTDVWEKLRREHGDDSPGWRRVQTGLDRIAAWCDRRQVRKVVVVFPFFAPHADGARDIMDKVAAAARQRGFEARSTLDDFGGAWADLAVSAHDAHPGAGAHTVIARVLAEMLGSVAPAKRTEQAKETGL
jgi:lysophospholipase L1-like esterase